MHAIHPQTPTAAPDRDHLGDAERLALYCQNFAIERDLSATLNAALEGMVRNLHAEIVEVFLWRNDPEGFIFESARGRSIARGRQPDPRDPYLARCLGEKTILGSPQTDMIAAVAYAPLLPLGRPCGVVRLVRPLGQGALDSRESALFGAMASAAALAIANAQLLATVEDQSDTTRDLAFAAEIQRHLLPSAAAGESPIFGLNRPIRQVSGDFFDFFTLPNGKIAFALGDVAGKGMNAALLMAKAASLYRCLGKTIFHPAEILERLNREIHETASRGMFVTMVAGTYDPGSGRLEIANAGHEPPLLRTIDQRYESYPADGPPLGVLPELNLSTREVEMSGGEFFIFSDGLTEFRYGQGEQLGVDGLIQMIEALSPMPLAVRMEALLCELDKEGWSMRDDLTVLVIDDSWVQNNE